ncbi:Asp-tRNA(Asn)/Glu-tRNA(Gln) amidotransferase subunit GatA [archaeon]|jgi:aspartyl-tRNA(Asn)/glutamyl-tRNA(Gln) amidotransferase subunit A|nr:Asp-tRNA(Asn)/Glu-tRNA(Gln) amidotransferase subunit GatA [archaeon]MBT4022694.1 Asp-tRNA(Asn)/Glu-tRNA(Gln) amidotransferase subunit GatA [archaeon]MBT4273112.1 Asp-tRNA(Asn)/Glu-tRNA(Gln) amidotransferase subunit GatA [archaeon]MBT4461093.1 Asp-tRNA(Asn)/Glu-tRNA(Gln) amidotransferase subunit GatA [archaeon]MBT4858762.1 Asp-tRNA(Asn)/Glu-tRNA(Gln) amidotransferase subunit GatA [archaeon]
MNSIDYIKLAKKGEIDVIKNTKETINEIKKIDKDYNYFLILDDKLDKKTTKLKKGKLYGLPISIKDCLCVKDMESKAGSKILEGYDPVFDSTVVKKIRDEGGLIAGKTSQDVFGFGSFNTNVGIGYKIPKNPFDKNRATGGSSGGAAGITQKLSKPHIAISESTGGSIACPASYCGVYGFTPTYGLVSRYGLLDYANSMDKIGIMAKDIEDVALMLQVIAGHDDKDSTSSNVKIHNYTKQEKSKFKVAVIKESIGKGVEKEVIDNLKEKLGDIKYDLVSLPLTFKYSIQTYYLISMSEASTNLAKLCGMRYGQHGKLEEEFNEYFSKVRSKYFSKEAKRRIILGTFARMSGYRDAFYIKALKVRTKIIEEYKKLFSKYDLLVTPTMPNIAPKFSEINKMTPLQNYMMDIMTAGPNLAGFPHLSIPSGFSNEMPTGLMIVANHFNEKNMIDFAREIK